MKIKFKLMIPSMAFILTMNSSVFAKSTEVIIQNTTPPPSNTLIITHPPISGYNVCYQRVVKKVHRNTTVSRCNPNGVCREVIIPHQVTVIRFENCTMMPQPCPKYYSRWSWYPTGIAAAQGLNSCRNQPIIIERSR